MELQGKKTINFLFYYYESGMIRIYIDEAGRGPLAGPLYVGLMYKLGRLKKDPLFRDSKQLSEEKRECAYKKIQDAKNQNTLVCTTASVSAKEIDRRGMTKSLNQAIKRGIKKLHITEEYELWIDGNKDFGLAKDLGVPVKTIINGDDLHWEISIASILAKVERDREMVKIHKKYPKYNFAKHKGYGTLEHRNAIKKHGPSAVHRMLFLRKILK